MDPATAYRDIPLTRAEVDAFDAPTLLDFGTDWCGYCRSAGPRVLAALARHSQVRHIRVEDGPGRRLGRSFGVRLWPTLVFLKQGREVARLVRPGDEAAIEEALTRLADDA